MISKCTDIYLDFWWIKMVEKLEKYFIEIDSLKWDKWDSVIDLSMSLESSLLQILVNRRNSEE